MNNDKKLTRIVLIVVTMAVIFELHTTFLVETAEADHYNKFCEVKLHRVYGTGISNEYRIDSGRVSTETTNCSNCTGQPASKHKKKWFYDKETTKWWYEHKYLIQINWNDCHVHTLTLKAWYDELVLCNYYT